MQELVGTTTATAAHPAGRSSARYDRLDALRALAMIWMALFHFCFDLSSLGFTRQDFKHDPFWLLQRTAIVSLFLLCAGAGLATALYQQQDWHRLLRRIAQVAACAILVTIGSFLMFPKSFIYFGVLHGIAVMLVLVRLAAPLGQWLWLLGAAAIVLPLVVQHPFFDTRWTNWIGLVTRKPITEDYVPVLPWVGALAWGFAATDWVLRHKPRLLSEPLPIWTNPLTRLGRWPLTFYMLHQPVFIGVLSLVAWVKRSA